MAITYRLIKGSPLTFLELDNNFKNLDDNVQLILSKYITTGSLAGSQQIKGALSINGNFSVINLATAASPTNVVTYNTGTGQFTTTNINTLFANLPALSGVITTGSLTANQSITGSLTVNNLTVNQNLYLKPLTQTAKPNFLTYDSSTGKVYYFPTSSFSKVGLITTGSSTSDQSITGSLTVNSKLSVTGSTNISGGLSVTGSVSIKPLADTPQIYVVTYNLATGLLYYTSSTSFLTNFSKVGLITTGSSTSDQSITGSLIVSSSFSVTGSTYLTLTPDAQNYVVTYDTASGKLYYTSSANFLNGYITTGSLSTTQSITGSLIVSNSLTITGSLYYSASVGNYNNVLVIDTGSGKLYYTSSEALGVGKTKAQSGSVSQFAGSPLSASISFQTAFPDSSYSVVVTGEDARVWTIQSKNSSGFQINSNSSVSLGGPVYWIATQFNNP